MRGSDGLQEGLFRLAKLDDFVPNNRPLRAIQLLVNEALVGLNRRFNAIYTDSGRASIAPEKLLRAMLVQVLFSIRSERQLMEQVRYNLLFHWFIGLAIDDSVWYHSIFSKNSDRLLENAVVESHTTRWGGSAVDGRTTRHTGYADSQRIRKHIEEHFGWRKTGGRIRQTVYCGLKRVDQHFKLTMTASNIVRMARLLTARPQGALQ